MSGFVYVRKIRENNLHLGLGWVKKLYTFCLTNGYQTLFCETVCEISRIKKFFKIGV